MINGSMILFITRKHPPAVGGMEQLSYQLTRGIAERTPARVIAWGGSQKFLPLFLMYAAAASLWTILSRPIRVVHVGDIVLAPLGRFLQLLTRRRVVITAHGLDIIYPHPLYRGFVLPAARKLDQVICISEHARQLCLARGFDPARLSVIPVGIEPQPPPTLAEEERAARLAEWDLTPRPRRLLLTVGRLVRRKGVVFFIREVMPRLPDDFVYLVVGDGVEAANARAAVAEAGLERRVRLLGKLAPDALAAAYALADVFVMPNIPVSNDAEGFGIVVLEARAAGLPVVAAALEGIPDACAGEPDARLVPALDAEAFAEALTAVRDDELTPAGRASRSARVSAQFGWPAIVDRYLAVFNDV